MLDVINITPYKSTGKFGLPCSLCIKLKVWTVQCYIRNMKLYHCFCYISGLFVAFAYGMFVFLKRHFNMFVSVNRSIFYNIHTPNILLMEYRWMFLFCLMYILGHVCFPFSFSRQEYYFEINCITYIIFQSETFYNLMLIDPRKLEKKKFVRISSILNTTTHQTLKPCHTA